jgi:hypothetical protein
MEALEGKAAAQFRSQKSEAALKIWGKLRQIWQVKLLVDGDDKHQRRRFLAFGNAMASYLKTEDESIADREEILKQQLKTCKPKSKDVLMTRLELGRNYASKKLYTIADSQLGFVVEHGQRLRSIISKEFKDAEKLLAQVRLLAHAQQRQMQRRAPGLMAASRTLPIFPNRPRASLGYVFEVDPVILDVLRQRSAIKSPASPRPARRFSPQQPQRLGGFGDPFGRRYYGHPW